MTEQLDRACAAVEAHAIPGLERARSAAHAHYGAHLLHTTRSA
jgi:hypothetical protein